MASLRTAACLLVLVACYDFTYVEPAPEAGADADADADAGSEAGACKAGGYYCGGDKVSGATDVVHRCNADGSATVIEKCANGCVVKPAGTNDACNPPTPCVGGSDYCGGDKINGDPDVLYKCGADGKSVSVIRRCAAGCRIVPNDDDECAP